MMDIRRRGLLEGPERAGIGDHLCWSYDDDRSFDQHLARYVASGLGQGERVACFLPASSKDRTVAFLDATLPDLQDLVDREALILGTFDQGYLRDGDFDPDARLMEYEAEVDRAVADGYSGLRVLGEATGILSNTDMFIRWPGYELRADLLAVRKPFIAACAFDRRLCHPSALDIVRGLHACLLGSPAADHSFNLHACSAGGLVLGGEVDFATATTLQRATTDAAASLMLPQIDVGELEFMDVAGMRALTAGIRAMALSHPKVQIVRPTPMFERLWELLDSGRDLEAEVSFA